MQVHCTLNNFIGYTKYSTTRMDGASLFTLEGTWVQPLKPLPGYLEAMYL